MQKNMYMFSFILFLDFSKTSYKSETCFKQNILRNKLIRREKNDKFIRRIFSNNK